MSILFAFAIDRWWGEPPVRLHPVVWMGHYLRWAGHALPERVPVAAFLLGALGWLGGALFVALAYGGAAVLLARLPGWLDILLTALLLKPLFALRMLITEVAAVEHALAQGIAEGRARLQHIVSRETAGLCAGEVRESALESLAENLSDSVVAPLFWFLLLGLPGAAVYRFANTADAMWGYRDRWEWAGKFAARADDLMNVIPARLTALTLLVIGPQRRCWRQLPREAARTSSPNSGWPMGALALSLGVRLAKPAVYTLNPGGREPDAADMVAALRLVEIAGFIAATLFALGTVLCGPFIHA